jgi:hypothetical protein
LLERRAGLGLQISLGPIGGAAWPADYRRIRLFLGWKRKKTWGITPPGALLRYPVKMKIKLKSRCHQDAVQDAKIE